MVTKITLDDGREATFENVSKTRPVADKDFQCCWLIKPPHTIKKGERYIRCVYKLDGEFRSDHICLECWVDSIPEEEIGAPKPNGT
jgi:hypothetical protein